jgi:hypothetical protein
MHDPLLAVLGLGILGILVALVAVFAVCESLERRVGRLEFDAELDRGLERSSPFATLRDVQEHNRALLVTLDEIRAELATKQDTPP